MPETTRRANALESKVRSGVEHVFAVQKDKMDLFIRTVGIARAQVKIGMANMVYNMKRLVFLDHPAPQAATRRWAVAQSDRAASRHRRHPAETSRQLSRPRSSNYLRAKTTLIEPPN